MAFIPTFVSNAPVFLVLQSLAFMFLFTAVAVAVLKYRLYDIDVVISKTVVYATLAAFFTAVYVAVVVGLGTAIGSTHDPFLTVAAAAVIAVAFNPVRERAKRLADRLVYGSARRRTRCCRSSPSTWRARMPWTTSCPDGSGPRRGDGRTCRDLVAGR